LTARTFVTLASLTVSLTPGIAAAGPAPPSPIAARADHGAGRTLRSDELYSAHARRRFAAYLRLRLLEMREAGLLRAAEVVEHRLPADTLVGPIRRR